MVTSSRGMVQLPPACQVPRGLRIMYVRLLRFLCPFAALTKKTDLGRPARHANGKRGAHTLCQLTCARDRRVL